MTPAPLSGLTDVELGQLEDFARRGYEIHGESAELKISRTRKWGILAGMGIMFVADILGDIIAKIIA